MNVHQFLNYVNAGNPIVPGSLEHLFMCEPSQRALQITAELNNTYHFNMFPPFYTDCGMNLHLGKNVWIGANVTVLPGVTIDNGAVIAAGSHYQGGGGSTN